MAIAGWHFAGSRTARLFSPPTHSDSEDSFGPLFSGDCVWRFDWPQDKCVLFAVLSRLLVPVGARGRRLHVRPGCHIVPDQIALILALKLENAGPVALLRSSDILFGFLFQYIFMNVVPEWTSIVGASLIVAAVLVTGVRKWCQGLPDGDRRKNSLKFLLA